MRLYIIRHGDALDKEEDPKRPLSEEGVREIEAMAAVLAAWELTIDEAWHSGKARARQTAEIVAARMSPGPPLVETKDLKPEANPKAIRKDLEKAGKNVLVAGHLPHLERLCSLLLTGDADADVVDLPKGGTVVFDHDNAGWVLRWMAFPEIVAAAGRSLSGGQSAP
jgi:phosphohistidine phosphatase